MIDRSIDMIFEPSGQPVPTEEEVQFEAQEIVQRSGWGMPLIERLRNIADPYWREAITRSLMELWRELMRDKDEQTYYYDMDGYMCYCWADAEYDFNRIIRRCTTEQVEVEQTPPAATLLTHVPAISTPKAAPQIVNIYNIQTNNGPIITDSNVTIH
jgi:hypothetical protein